MRIPFGILFFLRLVNTPIHFDDQAGGMAIKINDKSINHLLTAEMPASEFVRP